MINVTPSAASKITELLRLAAARFFHHGRGAVEVLLIRVADCNGVDIGVSKKFGESAGALAAGADEAHLDPVAGL